MENTMNQNFTKMAFNPSVKKVQEQFGSRAHYESAESSPDRYKLTSSEEGYIGSRDSFYISTVGENGWPYLQHRGGQKGFLKVIDDCTLAMPDFSGNAQYISTGNLTANNKAMLFLTDYPTQSRLKIWVETEILDVKENPELLEVLKDKDYRAKIQRIYLFHIKAYDWNCNQHITPRFTVDEFETVMKNQSY